MHQRSQQAVLDIQNTISENVQQYRDLKKYINTLQRQKVDEEKKSVFKKLWRKNNFDEAIETALNQLEFESLQHLQQVDRHYAFPSGDNGLTRLPVLIHLPETYDDFDVENFNASMSLDMNFSAGSRI